MRVLCLRVRDLPRVLTYAKCSMWYASLCFLILISLSYCSHNYVLLFAKKVKLQDETTSQTATWLGEAVDSDVSVPDS